MPPPNTPPPELWDPGLLSYYMNSGFNVLLYYGATPEQVDTFEECVALAVADSRCIEETVFGQSHKIISYDSSITFANIDGNPVQYCVCGGSGWASSSAAILTRTAAYPLLTTTLFRTSS